MDAVTAGVHVSAANVTCQEVSLAGGQEVDDHSQTTTRTSGTSSSVGTSVCFSWKVFPERNRHLVHAEMTIAGRLFDLREGLVDVPGLGIQDCAPACDQLSEADELAKTQNAPAGIEEREEARQRFGQCADGVMLHFRILEAENVLHFVCVVDGEPTVTSIAS